MPTYTITHAAGPRVWTGKYGENEEYILTLDGIDKPVELNQKPGKPAPSGTIDLTLEPHQRFPDKLKGTRPQTSSFNGGGRAPESPERQHMIVRQHSQTIALEICKLKISANLLTVEDFGPEFVKLCDFLDQDVRNGVKKALAA